MAYYAMRPIEIGVCQAPLNSAGDAGVWGFHIVQIPADTPGKDILSAATRAYLQRQENSHVYHTWIQCLNPQVSVEHKEEELGNE